MTARAPNPTLASVLAKAERKNGHLIWRGNTVSKGYGQGRTPYVFVWIDLKRRRQITVQRYVKLLSEGLPLTDKHRVVPCFEPMCIDPEHQRLSRSTKHSREARMIEHANVLRETQEVEAREREIMNAQDPVQESSAYVIEQEAQEAESSATSDAEAAALEERIRLTIRRKGILAGFSLAELNARPITETDREEALRIIAEEDADIEKKRIARQARHTISIDASTPVNEDDWRPSFGMLKRAD